MEMFRKTLYLIVLTLFISSKSYSKEPFIISSESLETIPNNYLSFLEGFNESVSFENLERAKWSEKILNAQSMVDGYWVRFTVVNNLSTDLIGLNHNVNSEKKIFVKNSLGIKEFAFWERGVNKHIEDDHFGPNFRIVVPRNGITTIYNFFRSKPFNRFMDTNNYHRMSIGAWENLRILQIATIVIVISLFTSSLLLGLYYFFIYLISKGNYIWLSLALLSICLMLATPIFLSTGIDLNLNQRSLFLFFPMLFLSLTQFFKKSLFLEECYPSVNKIFIVGIIFFISVIALNLILISEFPNENELNLTKYPPDKMGFGIIKLHHNLIAFGILLSISIIISFTSWQEGSSSSGYLCLSFILPFLILPIGLLSYYILDGFNFYFWSILLPVAGVLTLGMFVTFGFSVAQGMNDLKQAFIDKQLELNNELEAKVEARTVDLKKASEKLITANKDLMKTSEELTAANHEINKSIQAASVIQNAILPKIDLAQYGFRNLEYVWQPRDTIGGDFYWLEKKDGWTCLVVADCTGHGIPGAFMTLISSTLLDRISSLKDLSHPDAILNDLDEFLQKSLSLNERHQQIDFGLDAGVCCFSNKEKIFRYSGAKMNLYRKSDQDVVEIKGDKKSLGYDIKEHPLNFKVFECDLNEKSSSFFVFSDGVTDQVGGEKKLMYGKKRVISHIREAVDVKTAVNNIVADVERYQGVNKRRDDLTLFGFAV